MCQPFSKIYLIDFLFCQRHRWNKDRSFEWTSIIYHRAHDETSAAYGRFLIFLRVLKPISSKPMLQQI